MNTSRALSSRTADLCYERLAENYFGNRALIRVARGVKDLAGRFAGSPVIIAGAGPSLDAALPLLQATRKPIIALDRAVKPLVMAGVKPAFIVSIEIQPAGAAKMAGLGAWLKDVPLCFDPLSFPGIVDQHPGPLYTWDKPTEVSGKGRIRMGTGVVSYAVGLAELLGADPIILAGVDLAYPGGRLHAAGINRTALDKVDGPVTVRRTDGGEVESDVCMLCNIEELSEAASEGVRLVQTSPAGAEIPGALHLPLEQLA